MTGTLVDTDVLVDLVTQDPTWSPWSASAFREAVEAGPVFINPIVLAEVSAGFRSPQDVEEVLPVELVRAPLPWDAAFLAGKAYVAYRRRGGTRRSPLPDFYIGAHAKVSGLTLLTRDAERYRTYFKGLPLVTPRRRRSGS